MAEEIFTASTENLRDLKKQRKRICALVNRAIREKQDPDLISLTKLYALLYSALCRNFFLKTYSYAQGIYRVRNHSNNG